MKMDSQNKNKMHPRTINYQSQQGLSIKKELSLSSLIMWNVNKVREESNFTDIKTAIESAYERLEHDCNLNSMMSLQSEDQHIACAVLAWQRLGHKNADSLYQFITQNNVPIRCQSYISDNIPSKLIATDPDVSDGNTSLDSTNFETSSLVGPVVRLPVETKIVMHFENSTCARHQPKKKKNDDSNDMTAEKIDASCCTDSVCAKRLGEVDKKTKELRDRAAKLARREADRIELLERAETAWKSLELGYQRRINFFEEKEEDLSKQIKKLMEERNGYKEATLKLVEQLKEASAKAEKDRDRLRNLEKEMCDIACQRLRVSEAVQRGDSNITEQECRVVQLDRELQYKEEQARRKVLSIEGEVDSTRGLTIEVERALRAELSALKDQIEHVSKQLLKEEATNKSIKKQLDKISDEKTQLINELDGCKDVCDKNMQYRVDELKKKRDQLMELQNRVVQCQCRLPQDAVVEAKRTPSLAALCKCTTEDKLAESCSCTSLRSQLLSNLFSDLFSGLQAELGGTGSMMPCQLLKCLEDRHNWDNASVLKTSLRMFFAQLLVGELDIAIATSIEKYHARWVGASCVDTARQVSDLSEDDQDGGLQERVIERRAQKLATKLADEIFKEKADQLTKKAKDIISSGPPTCECKPHENPAVFRCLVKAPTTPNSRKPYTTPTYFKRTIQDVTELKAQIEDLKKDTIKKEDLKQMEDKITKIIQRATKPETKQSTGKSNKLIIKDQFEENKLRSKNPDSYQTRKSYKALSPGRDGKYSSKLFNNKKEQEFAVNLCLCGEQKNPSKSTKHKMFLNESKSSWNPNFLNNMMTDISNVKVTKPISQLQDPKVVFPQISSKEDSCNSACVCLHKVPTNSSIDNLLESLKVLKINLGECDKHLNTNVDTVTESLDFYDKMTEICSDSKEKSTAKKTIQSLHGNSKNSVKYSPISPQSEYMGAINLDKSNENLCRCNIGPLLTAKSVQYDIGSMQKNCVKCVQSSLCKCNNEKDMTKNKKSLLTLLCSTKSHVIGPNVQSLTGAQTKVIEMNKTQERDPIIKKNVEDSDHFPHTDYDINFLGVTLSNIKSNGKLRKVMATKNTFKNYDKSSKLPTKSDKKYNGLKEICDKSISRYKSNKLLNDDLITNSVDKNDNKQNFDNRLLEDNEPCVCCNHKDEPKELEVNAYSLLEEYLKGKMSKFKNNTCKSSCISPKEQEKIFSTILSKVKNLIAETTNQQICYCSNENNTDESWERAYGLLQEYIKMKMKRIKCSCIHSVPNEELGFPNILNNVCNLIDNDFQKLRDLCNCQKLTKKESEIEHKVDEKVCSTKEVNVSVDNSINKVNKLTSNPKIDNLPHSNHYINKSCDAMELNKIQRLEKVTSCKLNNLYVTDCDCRFTITEPSLFQNNTEILNTPLITIKDGCDSNNVSKKLSSGMRKNKHDDEQTFPYIGYTLDCSCDRCFGCVCTKSQVQTNDEKIQYIWKSLTDYSNPSEKLSYIMRSVPQKIKSEHGGYAETVYDVFLSDRNLHNNIDFDCDTQTSVHEDEGEIVLKESGCNLKKTSNKTNTDGGCSKTKANTCNSFHSCLDNTDVTTNKNTLFNSLYLPLANNSLTTVPSNTISNSVVNIAPTPPELCECIMVPMCHVKMLVTNIEDNLKNSKCMCDTMSSNVCPIHSKITPKDENF